MKVENITNSRGNSIPNQFIIKHEGIVKLGKDTDLFIADSPIMFQSYRSIIAVKCKAMVVLDKTYWNYSTTTSKYRNQFLGETTKETKAKIASGEYLLADLN